MQKLAPAVVPGSGSQSFLNHEAVIVAHETTQRGIGKYRAEEKFNEIHNQQHR